MKVFYLTVIFMAVARSKEGILEVLSNHFIVIRLTLNMVRDIYMLNGLYTQVTQGCDHKRYPKTPQTQGNCSGSGGDQLRWESCSLLEAGKGRCLRGWL